MDKPQVKASTYLSHDELRQFTARSNLAGLALLVGNWAAIALIFSVVAAWPNVFTALAALFLLGGRQLGLAVLMHEAGHKTLFRSQRLNQTLGEWLAAYPVLGDCGAYGASHREHHRLAGTDEDPDLPNYRAYPVSAASFRRKLLRDLTGQTGLRLLLGTLRGAGNRMMMRDGEGTTAVRRGLLANAALFAVLWLAGHPTLYLLWVAAYLTAYPLVARIRQVAEHGNVPALYERDPRGKHAHDPRGPAGAHGPCAKLRQLPRRTPPHAQRALLAAAGPARPAGRARLLCRTPEGHRRWLLGRDPSRGAGVRSPNSDCDLTVSLACRGRTPSTRAAWNALPLRHDNRLSCGTPGRGHRPARPLGQAYPGAL
jgi:hypothetical protein